MAQAATLTTILIIVLIFITIITFIVSIIQLSQIRKTTGYSLNSSLQNAYDFSIGVLILNLFALIFYVSTLYIFIKHHQTRSGSLVTLIIFATATLFGGIVVGGYAAAASKNGAAIGNLVVMIIGFIISVVLLFYLSKLPVYIPPDIPINCSPEIVETAALHPHEL
jgi:Na+-driven multidrug efflux pump